MAHVDNGSTAPRAMTVRGPVSGGELGVTLMHEHTIFDFSTCKVEPTTPEDRDMVHRPVSIEMLGYLRFNPLVVLDNLANRDLDLAADELGLVSRGGGHTIVDPTNRSIGRDPVGLKKLSEATGLHIVMGAGYYTECALDADFLDRSIEAIADEIARDVVDGVGNTGVRAGVIGEVGTSSPVTAAEETSLRGAARAQARTGAPLMIHIDGWAREGHRVLDICADEGADLTSVILCHMNPSWDDVEYQLSLAARGAYLEYDMFGNNHVYPAPMGPSPDELVCLKAIRSLIDQGIGRQILLSQDVYLKMMFVRFGGYGYAHILTNLDRHYEVTGISRSDLHQMLVENPRDVLVFA